MKKGHLRIGLAAVLVALVTALAWPYCVDTTALAADYQVRDAWQNGPGEYHPSRVVVKFQDAIFAQAATDAIGSLGYSVSRVAEFVPTARFINGARFGIVALPEGEGVDKAISKLETLPGILYAEKDYVFYPDSSAGALPEHVQPNDTYFDRMWGLHNENLPPEYWDPGMSGQPVDDADIDAADAWMLYRGSPEMIVAVIDTGTYIYHPDLAEHIWVNSGEIPDNGIDDDGNGYIDDVYGWDFRNNDNTVFDPQERDRYGELADQHGTHVSGTIGAMSNNGIGVTGINWQVQIMPLKFIGGDGGYSSDAILAVQYAADKGASVVNMSFGGGAYSQAFKDAIEASGILCVAAAGNSGDNTDITPHYPSSYDSPNIISVAASMQNDTPCVYSAWSTCYGKTTVDLFAPGGFILSTIAPDPPPAPGAPPKAAYAYFYGTSMATPHVTGVAALVAGRYPSLPLYPGAPGSAQGSPNVKDLILNTVDKKSAFKDKVLTGGRLNAENALTQQLGPVITLAKAEPNVGMPPLEVTFTASALDPAGGSITAWWEFGDGSPVVHAYNTAHTYAEQGNYTAVFHAVNNVGIESTASVEIRVYLLPTIGVTPAQLQSELYWGETDTQQITISNTGHGDLHYVANIELDLLAPDHAPLGAAGGFEPMGVGGPDNFGYFWIDNDHPNGPIFDWRDISAVGTKLTLKDDRDTRVDLPFTFMFYGQAKTRIRICSNGYLTFSNYGKVPMYAPIPSAADPNDLICPFWTDLNPEQGGTIYYYSTPDEFIVQYQGVARHESSERYTFQVILTPNGKIAFNYLEMGDSRLDEATIGIENSSGADGLQVAYKEKYVHDNLVVEFIPVWITVNPRQGTVAPGHAANVGVTFNAGTLPEAAWRATLAITSDDPVNPVVNVDTVLDVQSLIAPRIGSIQAQPWAGPPPLAVQFSADVVDIDGEIASIVWNFGDGSDPVTGTLTPTHTYTVEGSYRATLTVTDDDGLTSQAAVDIAARPIPIIGTTPTQFNEVVRAHRIRTDVLRIANTGGAPLTFSATTTTVQPPAAKWLSVNPASGTVAPGTSMDVQVKIDLTQIVDGMLQGAITLASNDVYKPSVSVPVYVEVVPNQPPQITACGVNPGRGPVTTSFQFAGAAYDSDGTIADMYWDFGDRTPVVHQAITSHTYAADGTYTAKFTAVDNDGYKAAGTVAVYVQQPPSASWAPNQLTLMAARGQSTSGSVILSNGGPGALIFGVDEVMGIQPRLERLEADVAASDPEAMTTEGLYAENVNSARSQFLPDSVGAVVKSWISPLPIAVTWGIGAIHGAGELVIGDPSMKEDFVVTTEGLATGKSYRTQWAGQWAADMTFDGEYIWQVNVGGDNGVYKLNPETGAVAGSMRTGAWTSAAQRGLAYDVNDDTFFVGGWVDDQIYKIKGESWDNPGEVLDQWEMQVGVAGLAYHPTANVLAVTSNGIPDMIYFVDPVSHAMLAQFPHPAGRANSGAGCEFDETGNLWVASQKDNMAYLVETGLGPIVDWLTWRPASGSIPAGGSCTITVTADASRLGPGTHHSRVTVFTNDIEYPMITVPVSFDVKRIPVITATATPMVGEPPLAVTFHAEVNSPETPLASCGWSFGDGAGAVGLDAEHTYAAAGLYTAEFTAVDQLGGTAKERLTIDVRMLPVATIDPAAVEITISPADTVSRILTLGNVEGHADLHFDAKLRRGSAPAVAAAIPKRTAMAADPGAFTAEGLYTSLDPGTLAELAAAAAMPDAVGGVIRSWPVPSVMEYSWGLGFDSKNVWIGDPFSNTDHLVTPEGVHTLMRFQTGWSENWAADLAFDENHNLMWQVNVGGDNGIYGLNPSTGDVEAVIANGPWTARDQRGLAYNSADDTFYIGGWTQDIIYHIKGLSWDNPGEVLDQWSFPVGIAGLAYHPGGVLWVANNGEPDMIYGLDAKTHAVLVQFQHPARLDRSGAGLAMHEDGNLWVASQVNRMVYLIDTGMPAVPGITIDPARGAVPAGQSAELELMLDGAKLGAPGKDVQACVEVATDDPVNPLLRVNLLVHVEAGPSIADVTATPSIGEPPLTVAFNASVSAGAKPIADAWWSFGDGSEPVHSVQAEHVYSEIGTYNAVLHVVDEAGVEVTARVTVTVKWLPQLEINPESFNLVIDAGSICQRNLTVANPGAGPMNFQVSVAPSFAESPEWKQYAASAHVKGDFAAEPAGFAGAGAGGPDRFGYIWADSGEANGPAFDWVEIREIGTRVPMYDESGSTVALPFEFPFYGELHRYIGIASNGYLSFDQSALKGFADNAPIPNPDDPNHLIAAFWDDLDPSAGGGVYYYHDEPGDRFIVEYHNVPQWGTESRYTFQIVLKPNGTIIYQYLSMSGDVSSATVGIENGLGDDGLQVVYNAPYVHDGLAVAFSPVGSVIDVNPSSGWLVGGASQDVAVTFGSGRATPGTYSLYLYVTADDPYRPFAAIPVQLKLNLPPAVTVSEPAAGSELHGNSEIKWTAGDPDDSADALTVDLYWTRDGETWNEIATSVPNTGSHAWNTTTVGAGGNTFRIRVVVRDPAGVHAEFVTGEFTIINHAPVAAFRFEPATATVEQVVKFTDESTDDGALTAWQWEFGDGATSQGQNPEHRYAAKGTYTTKLTVTDNGGLAASTERTVEIVNSVPRISLISPEAGSAWTANQSIDIEYSAIDPDDDELRITLEYDCIGDDFGWGTIAADQPNTGTYTWSLARIRESGSYIVRVTVTDADGAWAEAVSGEFTIDLNTAPVAAFSFSPSPATKKDTVQFTDESTDDGAIVEWRWEFGDGATSSQRNPEHKYGSKGLYAVKLTVVDNGGLTSTVEHTVEVINAVPEVTIVKPAAGSMLAASSPIVVEYEADDADDDELAVKLEYSRVGDEAGWVVIAEDQANSGSYAWSASGIRKGGLYRVRVTATDTDGASGTGTSGEFTVIALGNRIVAAAPNPAVDSVTFYYDIPTDGTLYVYTVAGSPVYTANLPSAGIAHEWNLLSGSRPVASGLYLYVVVSGNEKSDVGRLAIIR